MTGAIALVALGLSDCAPEGAGCGTPLGEERTDTLFLEDLPDELVVMDRVDVHWWPGDTLPRVVRHAWEGTLEGIHIEQEEGVLVMEDRNLCHWVRSLQAVPQVHLHGIKPDRVFLESQGDFIMEAPWTEEDLYVEGNQMAGRMDLWFEADSLKVRLPNGIGHASIKGSAVRFSTFRGGFGDLDAAELRAEQILAHHGGTGMMSVMPDRYLFLELSGPGTVYLLDEPEDQDIAIWPDATGEIVGP